MSKFDPLWRHIAQISDAQCSLTFEQIAEIAQTPIDHSFLTYKKELTAFGWQVRKISMKNQTVSFERCKS